MRCVTCGLEYSPATVFDHCTVSWPNQLWLLFQCPACGESSHVEVADGRAAIGNLDGGPGPRFFARQSVSVPGLRVSSSALGVTLTLDGTTTAIPAKR